MLWSIIFIMRNSYGFFITLLGLIVTGVVGMLAQNGTIYIGENYRAFLLVGLVASSILGGIFGPYKLKKNSFYASSMVVLYFMIDIINYLKTMYNDIKPENTWGEFLTISLMVVVGIAIMAIISLSSIVIAIGQFIGSLLGKNLFSKDRFIDIKENNRFYDGSFESKFVASS